MTLSWVPWAALPVVIWTSLIETGSIDSNTRWLDFLLAFGPPGFFATADYHRLYRYRSALPGLCLLLDMYFFYSAPPDISHLVRTSFIIFLDPIPHDDTVVVSITHPSTLPNRRRSGTT